MAVKLGLCSRDIEIYKVLCFDVAPGRMNWAPNKTRTHWCKFANHYTIKGTHKRNISFKVTKV